MSSPPALQPRTPRRHGPGLGSSPFARRYWGNRFYFLFLRVLRCFSSPRWRPLNRGRRDRSRRVAPFGNPRIKGHLPLPAAYRSLSRPSSPPRAKASPMRPWYVPLSFFSILKRRQAGLTVQDRPRLGLFSPLPPTPSPLKREERRDGALDFRLYSTLVSVFISLAATRLPSPAARFHNVIVLFPGSPWQS